MGLFNNNFSHSELYFSFLQTAEWISPTIKCKRSKNRAIIPKESVFWVLLDTKLELSL